MGDVTDDGRADIIVTAGGNIPNAFVNVFVQQPDGSLATSPTVYPAFHLPEAVEVGDVNHDSHNNVILSHAAWMSLPSTPENSHQHLKRLRILPTPLHRLLPPRWIGSRGMSVMMAAWMFC